MGSGKWDSVTQNGDGIGSGMRYQTVIERKQNGIGTGSGWDRDGSGRGCFVEHGIGHGTMHRTGHG